MYKNPYNTLSTPYREHVEKLNQQIKEELAKPKPDFSKITRLREAKFMPDLFSGNYMGYERFRSPW